MNQLNAICLYLKNHNIKLSKTHGDGRINSINNEDEILTCLIKFFNIEVSNVRSWADFFVDSVPVNIKITTTKTADNASSKEGLYYALTGLLYSGNNDWENYLRLLSENIQPSLKDYYFLVINKDNPQDILYNSLKCINKLTPNGNNLPFQIRWQDNKIPIQRSFEESKKLLLKALGKSLQLRANAYKSFKQYFGEYTNEC